MQWSGPPSSETRDDPQMKGGVWPLSPVTCLYHPSVCPPPLATWSHPFFSPSGADIGPLFLSVILLSPRTATLLFPLLNLLCPAPGPPTAPLLWRTYGLSKENINCIFLWASLSFCPRWQQSLHYMDWGGSLLSSEGTRLHTHRSMAVACKCLLSEGVEVMEEAMNGHTMLSVGTKKTGKANLGTDHKCN